MFSQKSVWSVDSACSTSAGTSKQATQRGGEPLHPVTDTVGTVRPGNGLKANHEPITVVIYVTATRDD